LAIEASEWRTSPAAWGVVLRLQVDAHDVCDASPQVANAVAAPHPMLKTSPATCSAGA